MQDYLKNITPKYSSRELKPLNYTLEIDNHEKAKCGQQIKISKNCVKLKNKLE